MLFLKVIIHESYFDTNATTNMLQNQLSNPNTYIATVNFDIKKLNHHAQIQLAGLQACGKTMANLLSNLFKAYKTVKDQDILGHIKDKERNYKDGTIQFTAASFISKAKNWYQLVKDRGEWQVPSVTQEKLLPWKQS